jgi:hypothetical protein
MTPPKPYRPPTIISLARVPVRRELVEWIADQLQDPAGDRLRRALDNDTRILGLEIDEREAIPAALDDPPQGLEELRATLLQEHVGRVRTRTRLAARPTPLATSSLCVSLCSSS